MGQRLRGRTKARLYPSIEDSLLRIGPLSLGFPSEFLLRNPLVSKIRKTTICISAAFRTFVFKLLISVANFEGSLPVPMRKLAFKNSLTTNLLG